MLKWILNRHTCLTNTDEGIWKHSDLSIKKLNFRLMHIHRIFNHTFIRLSSSRIYVRVRLRDCVELIEYAEIYIHFVKLVYFLLTYIIPLFPPDKFYTYVFRSKGQTLPSSIMHVTRMTMASKLH